MKRILTLIDCTAISITMLLLCGLVGMALRGLFLQLKDAVHDIHASHSDWVAGIIIFCLLWTAFKWKAGLRALENINT
jgi:hypothetical protein